MYISLDRDKDCHLLHDRPILSTGRPPHDKQNSNCLDYNPNLVMSPGGARRQDWLTDWPAVRCKVTDCSLHCWRTVYCSADTSLQFLLHSPLMSRCKCKGTVVPVLNYASRHEDVLRSGGTAPLIPWCRY